MPKSTPLGHDHSADSPSREWPTDANDLPLFLTPNRLAALLRISVRTLERARHEGSSIPFRKVGRRVLYARDDVLAHLADASFRSTAEAKAARL